MARRAARVGGLVLVVLGAALGTSRAADEVPEAFAPLEYLVGGWKGMSIPTANRLKGWPETHRWAWKFAKGTPVGMTVQLEGDKALKEGTLTYDEPSKLYRLVGTDPDGKPAAFAGKLSGHGKLLTLDRTEGDAPGVAKERLIVRLLPDNTIRYSLWLDRREPGAPRFSRGIETGLTREGEALGGGGGKAPKCIVTGGTATMTVSFQGKSFDICCTGCRDEFNDNPEKYVQKALARAQAAEKSGGDRPAASKDDGAFDGLVDAPKPKPKAAKPKPTVEAEKSGRPKPAADPDRAATLLKLGQSLEKSGKPSGALGYYRQIAKDHADSPQAKTAAERIKALEKK